MALSQPGGDAQPQLPVVDAQVLAPLGQFKTSLKADIPVIERIGYAAEQRTLADNRPAVLLIGIDHARDLGIVAAEAAAGAGALLGAHEIALPVFLHLVRVDPGRFGAPAGRVHLPGNLQGAIRKGFWVGNGHPAGSPHRDCLEALGAHHRAESPLARRRPLARGNDGNAR